MPNSLSDLHVATTTPLPAPCQLAAELSLPGECMDFIDNARKELARIIHGQSRRFVLIVGPCSIHDRKAGLEYAKRLAELQQQVGDKLMLVMRVYFEKPRTSIGWKGLIMDPDLDGSSNIAKGLREARSFLVDVIKLGLATATELLDPITPQYIADLICWSAIGARTTESQTHRQMASGLSMPLGFKNATSGSVDAAINAMLAASAPQTFLGVDCKGQASAVSTTGNPDCHVILRGGDHGPNFARDHVEDCVQSLLARKMNAHIIIDASHANCSKDYHKMPEVLNDIVAQRVSGNDYIVGAMLESNLLAGSQSLVAGKELTYGQSITDPCIDWETTRNLILQTHAQLD